METAAVILDLPFETLAAIAAGYMSYRVAYTGRDGAHSNTDSLLITLVFAFFARTVSQFLLQTPALSLFQTQPNLAVFIGILAALVFAIIWRKFLAEQIFTLFRRSKISDSDRHKSAWETLLGRPPRNGPTQLFVACNDGVRLLCERLDDFRSAPMGPCVLGHDGSVLIYVTHRKSNPGGEWEDDQSPGTVDNNWGYELTYVPTSRISEIRLRYPISP